jgi:hypothetical protein
MISAFNQIYKAFQGFLSQNFWYTIFTPLAIFSALHAAILTQFGWHPDLQDLLDDNGKAAKFLIVVIFLLAVLGFVLQGFLPLLRGFLDGSLLPKYLHDELRKDRLPAVSSTRKAIDDALQRLGQMVSWRDDSRRPDGQLSAARNEGDAVGKAANEPAVLAAEEGVRTVDKMLSTGRDVKCEVIEAARSHLISALRVNSSKVMPPALDADLSRRLRQVDNHFRDLLLVVQNEAKYEYQIQLSRLRVARALDVPRATLLGDARYAVESYAKDVYNVDFSFLWPRLVIMLRSESKDDAFLAAVDAVSSRLDFATLCLLLVLTLPLVWLPAVVVASGPIWLIPVLGATTPLALAMFYKMLVEGQLAFGDAINTVIDRHRFIVLKMLRQAPPTTRAKERELWRRIREAEEDGRAADLEYTSE